MTDFFIARERDNLFRRIEELTPTMRSRKSLVTGHTLICHFNDELRTILGLQAARGSSILLSRTLWRFLVFNVIPWPEREPRNEAALQRFVGLQTPRDFASDHAEFVALLKQLDARINTVALEPHPTFGALSVKQWGRCLFLHIDFHLTQFGIHGEFAPRDAPLSGGSVDPKAN
jgi:hypothetical protein